MNPLLKTAMDYLNGITEPTSDEFLAAQTATAYALVAIAEELGKMNERAGTLTCPRCGVEAPEHDVNCPHYEAG